MAVPPSPQMAFGKAIHDALDVYYNPSKGVNQGKVELAIMAFLHAMDGVEEIKGRTREDGIQVLRNYFNRWQQDDYEVLGSEVGFSIPVDDFLFVGRIDRYVVTPWGNMPLETKTTGVPYVWGRKVRPNLQIEGCMAGIYATTGELPAGGILDIIPVGDKAKQQRLERFITFRKQEDMDVWLADLKGWWKVITAFRESDYWPRVTEQCVPFAGSPCGYMSLCEQFPFGTHEPIEDANFTYSPWVPFPELAERRT